MHQQVLWSPFKLVGFEQRERERARTRTIDHTYFKAPCLLAELDPGKIFP